MNTEQETHVLDWVEAMLSGKYQHGREVLFNPTTKCYCALGVAAVLMGARIDERGMVWWDIDGTQMGHRGRIPEKLFSQHFGLNRPPAMYAKLSDMSTNYLAVVALLLNAVPVTTRQQRLHAKFWEQVDAKHRSV